MSLGERHICNRADSWWAKDAQGIPLCRVCSNCVDEKLQQFRPEILSGYTQADVDEPIEPDDGWLPNEGWDGEQL